MFASTSRLAVIACLFASQLSGCAALSTSTTMALESADSVELESTPFFPQQRFQCGPAAVATVLAADGVIVEPESIADLMYIPERRGSLQSELIASVRAHQRLPYVLDPNFAALLAELDAGRPVVVLQNLGISWLPKWHYAVVVGFDAERREVFLRSGTDKRRITALHTFMHTWRRGDYWALTVLSAGEFPKAADSTRYFQAAAALETVTDAATAYAFWTAAARRWPAANTPRLGQANALLAAGEPGAAAEVYESLLNWDAQAGVIRNNYALSLARSGRSDAAIALLTAEIDNPRSAELLPVLKETLSEIRSQVP